MITAESVLMTCYRLPRTARLVLDEHNIEYDILRRTTAAERPSPRKLYNWANYLKLRREERAAWQQFDGITLPPRETSSYCAATLPSKRTAVIPNGGRHRVLPPLGGASRNGHDPFLRRDQLLPEYRWAALLPR